MFLLRTSLAFLLPVILVFEAPSQDALLRRQDDLYAVSSKGKDLRSVLNTLLRGPSPSQRQAGIKTSIPSGTRLVDLKVASGGVTLTLSREFLSALGQGGALEDALEQINKTVFRAGAYHTIRLQVHDSGGRVRTLHEFLAEREQQQPLVARAFGQPRTMQAVTGALSGKTIAVSPGHGYYWHPTLGWTTQRPLIDGLIEDIHTNEIAMRYMIPALENMGARVISCRERGEITHERIGDNDSGAPLYVETGTWNNSGTGGYAGGGYRMAFTSLKTTATATWWLGLSVDGIYPVYIHYPAGAPWVVPPGAIFRVHHSGGIENVLVDQSQDDSRWHYLGTYSFGRNQGARIVLDNANTIAGKLVVADTVRVGGGMGSISRGSGTSKKPRWQECSRYWAQFNGASPSIYNSSTGNDHTDDVTARPRYAEWRGADCYISLHTNAGGTGSGTSSYIYNGGATAGSKSLQAAVQKQVVQDIRSEYDPSWIDRGSRSANFGEVRLLKSMPGVLLELAFHHLVGSKDHKALHDPRFRYIGGRAYARGVMRYFNPSAAFPPEPPDGLRATQDGSRGLRVSWEPAAGATAYGVEQSPDGKGFVEVARTTSNSWSTGALAAGTVLSFRLRAWNPSGRSFPSEVLTAGTSHTKTAALLLVQGFDRLQRTVKYWENTKDYLRLHGDAISRNGEFSVGFDAASNEAVILGRVKLASYNAVDWASGEESTKHETFSTAEQGLVRAYLQQGGRLLVSGAEIGWDLEAKGSSADLLFYRSVIGARYVRDDAGTYSFGPAGGSHIYTGLGSGIFDNGNYGTYDVDYPDVIAPADSRSQICLSYGALGGAAIQRVDGQSRVVYLGFPLETIVDADLRAQVMGRALRFLLSPRSLEAGPEVGLGQSLPLKVNLPGQSGFTYTLAASLSLGSILLPGDHLVPLAPDAVLTYSLLPQNGIFVNFIGKLDATGQATASLKMPYLPSARGLNVYISGISVDPAANVRTVLEWVRVRVK